MESNLKPFIEQIKSELNADKVTSVDKIQTLWSGYGGIYRLNLAGGKYPSVIVKLIDLQDSKSHPRGWATNLSHQRKLTSYQVEMYWYENYAGTLPETVKVPHLLYSEKKDNAQVLVLEDLSIEFPKLKEQCTFQEAKTVVKWLAQFHADFLKLPPKGLWPVGSYWHLKTRPDEWKAMGDSPLKANAKELDEALNKVHYKTIIHGDAKVANFCFNEDGSQVSAVDFQYVGGGVGVKDLVYFLGSCLTEDECQIYEQELLDFYFRELKLAASDLSQNETDALDQEWRQLYSVAWADFNRFLLGWMPTHQKLTKHALAKNKKALEFLKS